MTIKSRWRINNFLRDQDQFGKSVPSFNIRGDTSINTVLGGFFSILILIITLSFATKGLIDVYLRNNPIINVYNENDYWLENKLNLRTDSNFRFAFAAGQHHIASLANSNKAYDDTRYVKWVANYKY